MRRSFVLVFPVLILAAPLLSQSSAFDGLWMDTTPSYRLRDSSKTWTCSNTGWLYISGNSGASSEAMPCTTPQGNDLSWAGGFLKSVNRAGNHLSFYRGNGIFGRSETGCQIDAILSGDTLQGKQTCRLSYKNPYGGSVVASTVEGPWEAHRAEFARESLPSTACDKEKTLRRPNLAGGALVLFENKSAETLQIIGIGLNGQRLLPPDPLAAHTSLAEPVPSQTPLMVTDNAGKCKAIFIPNTQATRVEIR